MSDRCKDWSQALNWKDIDLSNLGRLIDVAGQLVSEGCADICAIKFLLADLIEPSELQHLKTQKLLDLLVANYDGNALVPELLYSIGRYDVLRKQLGVKKDEVERRLDATPCPFLSNYRKKLHKLSRSLDSKDYATLSLLCSAKLDKQVLANAKCGHDLFTALEKGDIIKQSDVSFLIEILRSAKLFKLAKEWSDFAACCESAEVDASTRGRMRSDSSGIPTTAGEYSASGSGYSASGSVFSPVSDVGGKATAAVRPVMNRAVSLAPSLTSQTSDASLTSNASQSSQSSVDLEEDSRKVSKQELQMELEQMRRDMENLKLNTERLNQKHESYTMLRSPRGLCLIVNIETFEANKFRKGSEIDCALLSKTFQKLNFLVTVEYDCDRNGLYKLMESYRLENHYDYDCFVVCLMSHGSDGNIVTTDDKSYPIMEIMKMFDGNNCPSLAGKPKLFFVQACQGKGKMMAAFENDLEADSGTDDDGIPAMSDFVLSLATFPGHVAFRSKSEGSWFIIALCEVLDEKWERMHLVDMLIEVNNRVAQAKANQGYTFQKQCPAPTITLRKSLWFTKVAADTPERLASRHYEAEG